MAILSFLRSIYLYTYYHSTLIKSDDVDKPDPILGFIIITFMVTTFNAAAILLLIDKYIYRFIHSELTETLFVYRGSVSMLTIIAIIGGCLIAYLVCCKGIEFNSIPNRLNEYPWLVKFSRVKLLILPLLSMAIATYICLFLK